MLAVEVIKQEHNMYLGNSKEAQSSKRGHACCRKISSLNWLYRKLYKAEHHRGDLNLTYADWNGNTGGNN